MSFEGNIASLNAAIIESTLFSILDELIADPELRDLEKQYRSAADKTTFIGAFRSHDGVAPPQKNPQLLSRFAHVTCIRTLIVHLAREKAWHNQMHAAELQDPCHPALESIARAIEMQKNDGLTIEGAIDILKDMILQIVGTEHPTDPFSEQAHDLYTELAQAMELSPPDEQTIRDLLKRLLEVDMTPSVKRKVAEEVKRNIGICLEPLYDQAFRFRKQILDAFRHSYGESAYQQHRSAILLAIEGGVCSDGRVIPSLLSQASWPGGDSDGNTAVDADATALGMSQYRIAVAEKHAQALTDHIVTLAKQIERKLRKEHTQGLQTFKTHVCDSSESLVGVNWKQKVRAPLDRLSEEVQTALNDRAFSYILSAYQDCRALLTSLGFEDCLDQLIGLENQVKHLIAFTQFSGMHREQSRNGIKAQGDTVVYQDCDGALQKIQKQLLAYAKQVGTDHKAIYMIDATGKKKPATPFILEQWDNLARAHADILNCYPLLRDAVEGFRFIFKSVGMTYGQLHIRQNAGIYTQVWDILLRACQHEPLVQGYTLFQRLETKSYKDLSDAERSALHAQLNDESHESKQLRALLFHMFMNNQYPDLKSKDDISLVRMELQRVLLAIENADLVELIIIANTTSSADLAQVESLFNLFPLQPHEKLPTIVPLIETPDDLLNYREILTGHLQRLARQTLEEAFDREKDGAVSEPIVTAIFAGREQIAECVCVEDFGNFLLTYPKLSILLGRIEVESMFGYSDTQKAWGSSALLLIKKTRELFMDLVQKYGMRPRIFDGPGGDLIRGGTLRNDATATLQGRARDLLNTDYGVDLYRGAQFYREYLRRANPAMSREIIDLDQSTQNIIDNFIQASSQFFKNMHDDNSLYGQLLGALIARASFWAVGAANVSSRATQRGIDENKGDRTTPVQSGGLVPEKYVKIAPQRAISAMEAQEMLREMFDFISAGIGMISIGRDSTKHLLEVSETFAEVFFKEEIAATIRDLSLIAEVLFESHAELNPMLQSDIVRAQWALECEAADFAEELDGASAEIFFKDSKNEARTRYWLSRYLAWISIQCDNTTKFMLDLEHELQAEAANSAIEGASRSLLSHHPDCERDLSHMLEVADPLYHILAQQCSSVSQKVFLDKAYPGLNTKLASQERQSYFDPLPITDVGRFFGAVASGSMVAQTIPPSVRQTYGNLRRFSVFAHTQSPGPLQFQADHTSVAANENDDKSLKKLEGTMGSK